MAAGFQLRSFQTILDLNFSICYFCVRIEEYNVI